MTMASCRRNLSSPKSLAILMVLVMAVAASAQAAGPVYWDWPQGRNFSELERDGMGLNWQGVLVPGLSHRDVGPSGPEVYWDLAPDGQGGVLIGSGHGGELFRLDREGGSSLMAQLEGQEIFSTLVRSDGSVLVGCGSGGQLYRVQENEDPQLIDTVEGGYIWDMVAHPATNEVWLATGSPAGVYRLTAKGVLEKVHDLNAQNCLALAFQPNGSLLMGTQGPGLVLKLDPQNPEKLETLFQTPQDEVRQFVTGPKGETFLLALNTGEQESSLDGSGNGGKNGKMPPGLLSLLESGPVSNVAKSALFRLDGAQQVLPYWSGNLDLMMAAWSPSHGWLAGGALAEGESNCTLHGLTAPSQSGVLAVWPGGDILDILVLEDGTQTDRILVAQAHPGGLTELGGQGHDFVYAQSPALDGGQITEWGRLRWQGHDPKKRLKFSARSGNTSEPDETWSEWKSAWKNRDQELDVPAGRFLQWRVELSGTGESEFEIKGVSVSGWQANMAPSVVRLDLEQVSDISLGGMLNGSDNVTQSYRSGLKAEFSRNSRADRRADGARAAVTRPVRVFTWQGDDPNGDRLVYDLEYQGQGENSWRTILGKTQESIGAWDTSDVPDGRYQVRLTASDELDNPLAKSLKARLETGPVMVDNTAPVIENFRLQKSDAGFRVSFRVTDAMTSLAGALLYLPDGTRQRLDPVDRICDSLREDFQVEIPWPGTGATFNPDIWQIRVEVRDLAGNLALAQGELNRK